MCMQKNISAIFDKFLCMFAVAWLSGVIGL